MTATILQSLVSEMLEKKLPPGYVEVNGHHPSGDARPSQVGTAMTYKLAGGYSSIFSTDDAAEVEEIMSNPDMRARVIISDPGVSRVEVKEVNPQSLSSVVQDAEYLRCGTLTISADFVGEYGMKLYGRQLVDRFHELVKPR